jgi:hypothetical protein
MAVDTILLSFCEDCTANNEIPQFAPKMLMAALGKVSAFIFHGGRIRFFMGKQRIHAQSIFQQKLVATANRNNNMQAKKFQEQQQAKGKIAEKVEGQATVTP